MKCNKALQLLDLSREGELSSKQERDLEQHLRSCAACSLARRASDAVQARISPLRNATPVPYDPTLLTHAIMQAISHVEDASHLPAFWTVLVAPRLRLALATILLLVGGLSLVQTEHDARQIAALEGRLSRRNLSRTTILGMREADAVPPFMGSLRDLAEAFGKAVPGAAHDGDSLPLVRSLAGSSSEAAQHRITIGQFLLKRYPELATVRFDDGLNQRERQVLVTEGEPFLKDVEALIRKGDADHER
jgi:hypothetical protein